MRRVLAVALLAACNGPADEPAGDDPSAEPIAPYDPLPLVDPFIATGGQFAEVASVSPAAKYPLGMTQVGPDTRGTAGQLGALHCAGYWYPDDHVVHFSLTHAHGMGVPDYGAVPFMPRDGWDPAWTTARGRAAPFDHEHEWATPGRYGVVLQDHDITVDAVATERGAHVRFTFPERAEPVLVFDLGAALDGVDVVDAWGRWAPGEAEIAGLHRIGGGYSERFGGLMTHFVGRLDPAPVGGGGWTDPDAPEADLRKIAGTTAGFWLEFPEGTTQVDLRVAISYVDEAGARKNLEAELPDGDFDARLAEVEEAWRGWLGRVRVRGGTEAERRIFHTALYHALHFPQRQDDVDGRYRGPTLPGSGERSAIYEADGPHYSDLSLWDTFRTLHPWYVLAWPELQTDVLRSIVRMIETGGYLPMWPLAHGNTGGMVGSPAMQVLSESWQKGLRDFDVETAYAAAFRTATERVPVDGRNGIESYRELGWVPVGEGSVSDTLEYAWNDHALMLWAEALGKADDAAVLAEQADNWRNVWNAELGFNVHRHADGSWGRTAENFDAILWTDDYVEGNAWHYVWYAPFDIEGMIELQHGGDVDAFEARLRDYWAKVAAEPDDFLPDDYYWHGNEPVMHYAFLGALAGRPDITADAARLVQATRYGDGVDGLDGNDDAGTLSAWYLLSSVGLFPVAGTTVYAWSPPVWERVELDRGLGLDPLVFRAPGVSEARRYLAGWQVGDTPVEGAVITHDQLVAGGDLVVHLSEEPGAAEP